MIKVSSREIIDIVRYDDSKAIFVEKKPILDNAGKYKVSYFVLNFENGEKEVITKNAYLRIKFGTNYKAIIEKVVNFVQCEARVLPNKNVLVVYPGGQAGIFDPNGELIRDGMLSYNDNYAFGIADDGDYFWSCCPNENCVVRFYADSINMDIRVGGKDSKTFINPTYVTADNDYIYVCCDNTYIRKIDKSNFAVTDIRKAYSDLQRYYKFGRFSIICTSDGAYIDKD